MSNYGNRRIYTRHYYEAPMIYAGSEKNSYSNGTMYNISAGGMYFETDYMLDQDSHIYIKMINFSPDTYTPGAYKAYMAKVVWCRKTGKKPIYGAGVRYVASGHIPHGRDIHGLTHSCDLCGHKTSPAEIHETDDSLHLCPDCFRHLGRVIDGKIRDSVLKFISGNVL